MGQEERLVELGVLLRERREELGLRRSELARRVGVTQAYIARIEDAAPRPSGTHTRPSEGVLTRWTHALHMSAPDHLRALTLAGRLIPGDATGQRVVQEHPTVYGGDIGFSHPLLSELQTVIERAETQGELSTVEAVLRPLVALLHEYLGRDESPG